MLIKRIDYNIINHVRRDGNKAVDFLANWGRNEQGGKVDSICPMHMEEQRWEPLKVIITHDKIADTNSR